ncbi:MAG TPA: DUF6056 family protein, partial [Candidatus Cloacimonadota bacterium]|nr:DUF6056 family protein [Candidatus Cloacimonadota bacterium]
TNRQTRFCSDDYLYSHKFDPGFAGPNPSSVKYEKIDSLPDYVESLSRLYQTLTGRIVPHAILQVILLLPGWVFDLLNTLVLFALTYLYTTWIVGRKHPGRMALWLLATLLWYLAISQSKRNFYLPAFSINYVWTQGLLFLFLIPVRRLIQEEERGGGKGQALALLFYGIIVGATNEPAVPAVLMAMGIWGLLAFIRSPKSLPLWYYSGMTGLVLGFIFMFLAPGNSGRAVYESTHTGSGGIGFSLANLRSILRDLAVSLPTICLGIWGIFSLNRQEFKERWRTYLFLLAALSGTLFALFFTPIYPNRVSILFVGYIIIIGLSLFTIKWGRKPVLLSLCLLLGLVPFGFRLMKDYQWAQHSEGEYQLFVKQIEACKLDSCLVNPRAYSEALTRENWAKAVASYYGKDYIGVKSAFSEEQQAAWQRASYQQAGSSDLDLVGLSYVNHDPFTRTIYVILKTDEAGFAPDKAMIAVKTADLPDWAESLAWRIPRSILYNLLPSVIIHRPQELFVSNDYAIYSIAMPIEDGKDDILVIGLKEKGKTVGRLFLSEISFR